MADYNDTNLQIQAHVRERAMREAEQDAEVAAAEFAEAAQSIDDATARGDIEGASYAYEVGAEILARAEQASEARSAKTTRLIASETEVARRPLGSAAVTADDTTRNAGPRLCDAAHGPCRR